MAGEQYSGPHQNMRCTADTKIDDWYMHDETENKDVKADDKTTFDAKYKHNTGYVRYKLYSSYPKVGDSAHMTLTDDAQARFAWRGLTTTLEFKKDDFYKEVDFGTYAASNWFFNPYYRWASNRSFKNNSLALGFVTRMNDLMVRSQLVAKNLNEGEEKVGDVMYEEKGKYVRDQMTLEYYHLSNITQRTASIWKMLLQWSNKDYGATLNFEGKGLNMPKPKLALRYRACDNMSVGAHYTYDQDDKDRQHRGAVGVKYVGDKDTTIRATADCCMNSKLNVSHRLSSSCSMNFTFQHNLLSWTSADHTYKKGFLGYPFNYGLVFKLDG